MSDTNINASAETSIKTIEKTLQEFADEYDRALEEYWEAYHVSVIDFCSKIILERTQRSYDLGELLDRRTSERTGKTNEDYEIEVWKIRDKLLN